MKNLIIFLAIMAFGGSLHSQVNFEKLSLEEIESQRPIFVDVYTTWCGPCKKMDRTTFQDSKVSTFLNENFVCLKWDAEHEKFKHLAEQFEVTSYPTFLFLSPDHKLISRQIGFMQVGRTIEVAQNVLDFADNDPFDNVEISSLNLDEAAQLLSKVMEMDAPKKSPLVKHLIEKIGIDDSLWEKHAELISLCASNDMPLEHVQKLIEYHEPIQSFSFEALTKHNRIERKLKSILQWKLKDALKKENYPRYREISQSIGDLALSHVANRTPSYTYKQLQTDRLNYYRYHRIQESYRPLADSLVSEFILPNLPTEVAKFDKSQAKSFKKFEKIMSAETEEVEIDSSALDFYEDSHRNSLKLANRLNRVALGYLMIYDDIETLEKALEYSVLSYEYIQLPRYLITRAKIQHELGNTTGAIDTLKDARANQFYQVREIEIEDLLIRFGG